MEIKDIKQEEIEKIKKDNKTINVNKHIKNKKLDIKSFLKELDKKVRVV